MRNPKKVLLIKYFGMKSHRGLGGSPSLGNGRLGAMVFGHPTNERIQLNDDSLWPDDLQWEHPTGGPEELKTIRQKFFCKEMPNQQIL